MSAGRLYVILVSGIGAARRMVIHAETPSAAREVALRRAAADGLASPSAKVVVA